MDVKISPKTCGFSTRRLDVAIQVDAMPRGLPSLRFAIYNDKDVHLCVDISLWFMARIFVVLEVCNLIWHDLIWQE